MESSGRLGVLWAAVCYSSLTTFGVANFVTILPIFPYEEWVWRVIWQTLTTFAQVFRWERAVGWISVKLTWKDANKFFVDSAVTKFYLTHTANHLTRIAFSVVTMTPQRCVGLVVIQRFCPPSLSDRIITRLIFMKFLKDKFFIMRRRITINFFAKIIGRIFSKAIINLQWVSYADRLLPRWRKRSFKKKGFRGLVIRLVWGLNLLY